MTGITRKRISPENPPRGSFWDLTACNSDDVTKRVSSALESAVEKTLHRFNVPTHKELQKLTSKVDTLGAKIDSMRRTKSPARAKAAGRVKTARKPAPKRARARR